MPVRLCYDPRFIHAEEWDDAMLLNEVHARKDAIAALGRQFGVRRIRVFGSVARGEEQPGSDIDFLVDFPPLHPAPAIGRTLGSLVPAPGGRGAGA